MQVLLSTLCLALTSAVVGYAYMQKKQFYPAVVYITKSNAAMVVIYLQFFVIVFMFGKLLRKIFLGTLRAAEFEHLLERFWYALTETCLTFTVFRDDFNPRFVALFTVLLFLKSFHWLAEERVDFMERSPVLGWLFHIRVASLLIVLATLDYKLLTHAYESTIQRGPTVQLVFGFEYAILLTIILSTTIKYALYCREMRTDQPWENKAVFLLYTELIIGFIKVILYILFVVIMAKIYALPMFVFRPMFITIRNFKKALSDVIMSRRAIRNMNTLYPDATAEELRLSDNICIICREDMVNHAKKLPCGHIFHTTCLRSWFQRQQTCPTCRLNILRTPNINSTPVPRQEQAGDDGGGIGLAAAAPAAVGLANAAPAGSSNTAEPDTVPRTESNIFENIPAAGANGLPNFFGGFPGSMIPPPPPFSFMTPYSVPLPPMPPDLTSFTDDELKAMEGNERSHVEERLKLLRNIQLMLDTAGILMRNYQIVAPQQVISSSTFPSSQSTTNGPSTSAAAGLSTVSSESIITAQPNASASTSKVDSKRDGVLTSGSKQQLSKNNEVTIEDLGVEDIDADAIPSTSKVNISINDISDGKDLNELRKRRLKFMEKNSRTSTAPTSSVD